MKNKKLTALILCITMLFSITSGIFSAAFASDGTTGSAYSLDTTTGSAYKEDNSIKLFSTKAKAVEVAEETPVPDYSAYAVHKGMYATFSEAGYFEACQDKPTTYKDMGIAMLYYADEFTEDILFEVRDYTVVHDYYDITDEDTGAVTGVTTVSSLWYQLAIISGETIDIEEPLFQNGFWVFQNYLAGMEPYVYDALTLFAPETGKTVQFKTDIFPSLYASIGGTGFSTMKEVPSAMVIIEKYTDENGEVWYYVDAVEGETWPTDCAGYHYVKANMVEVVEQEEEEDDETPALETTTDNKTFAIYDENGALPEGAILDVEAIDETTTTYIEETVFGVSPLPEGYAGVAYDISILDENDEKVQPDGSVVVRITGIDTENYNMFVVLHFAEGIDAEPEALEVTAGDGYIEFITDGFSTYYVVSGTQEGIYTTSDIYYVLENTTIFLKGTVRKIVFTPSDSNTSTTYDLGLSSLFPDWSSLENDCKVDIKSEWNFDDSLKSTTINTSSESKKGKYEITTLTGTVFTMYILTPDEMFNILEGLDEKDKPKAFFKILNNSTVFPNEPVATIDDEKYTYVRYNSETQKNQFSRTMISCEIEPGTLLNLENIANYERLAQSAIGENVIGIVDRGLGQDTLQHVNLSKDQWHKVLIDYVTYCKDPNLDGDTGDKIPVIISGEIDLTTKDDTQLSQIYDGDYRYQMYPYVIKMIGKNVSSENEYGWHVDCAIIDKQKYSLAYDYNLGTAEFSSGNSVTKPATTFYDANKPIKIGTMYSGTEPININDEVTVYDNGIKRNVQYKFVGWNTMADGSGILYSPEQDIIISQNMILYAIWQRPKTLRLVCTESFADVNDPRKELSREYTFSFIFNDNNKNREYSVLNTVNNVFVREGVINGNGTITLSGGQTAVISNVTKETNVTVTETVDGGADSVSFRVGGGSLTPGVQAVRTVDGSANDVVEFLHEFEAQLGNLTITADNVNIIDKDQSFIYRISKDGFSMDVVIHCLANQNSASVTINSLPIGNYTVTELSDWSWRYTPINGSSQTISVVGGSTVPATFGHNRNNLWWLDGNAWRNILSI